VATGHAQIKLRRQPPGFARAILAGPAAVQSNFGSVASSMAEHDLDNDRRL